MTSIPATLDALRVPVSSLSPYKRNARQGDVGAIVDSLERHGQYRPIVVNARTHEVLAGNHTFAAAVQLGWDEIAATFVDVDEDTAARIVLVDNRTNDLASYDDPALAELLQELAGTDAGLAGTGFTGDDLDDLLGQIGDGDELLDPFAGGGDDGAAGTELPLLRFCGRKVPMTEHEADRLVAALDAHIEAQGSPAGFVNRLVGRA